MSSVFQLRVDAVDVFLAQPVQNEPECFPDVEHYCVFLFLRLFHRELLLHPVFLVALYSQTGSCSHVTRIARPVFSVL